MNKNDLKKYIDTISINCNKHIEAISSIKYHYEIDTLLAGIENLSVGEMDVIFENLINDYLEKISKIATEEKLKKYTKEIDDVTSFFFNEGYSESSEEGSHIAIDLLYKLLGKNGRKLELPVKISFIKDYCINNTIEEKDIKNTLLWIILELSTTYYIIKKYD